MVGHDSADFLLYKRSIFDEQVPFEGSNLNAVPPYFLIDVLLLGILDVGELVVDLIGMEVLSVNLI